MKNLTPEMTEEKAKTCFEQLSTKPAELSDDALDNVSGGVELLRRGEDAKPDNKPGELSDDALDNVTGGTTYDPVNYDGFTTGTIVVAPGRRCDSASCTAANAATDLTGTFYITHGTQWVIICSHCKNVCQGSGDPATQLVKIAPSRGIPTPRS